MKTLELRKATGSLARYVGDAQKGPVVFTVKGDPIAALVPSPMPTSKPFRSARIGRFSD
jgi:antitoxin (DNA-binding transcriptional repressor) of toxin-antitoxin stability system